MTDDAGFGHAVEPVFPSETPPAPPPGPAYDITYKIRGMSRVTEAAGDEQRDNIVAQLGGEFGATDIEVWVR